MASNPKSKIQNPKSVSPYSALAAGYDVVMEHVDYAFWADYAHRLLTQHHPGVRTVLELGCGTGSLALELQPLSDYRYAATDAVPEMIRVARAKAELQNAPIQFAVADFTDFRTDPPVDALVLLYDGMNYLLEAAAVLDLFRCAFDALTPGGLFLFDQSTPTNSINNEPYFEDVNETEGFAYRRLSRYDRERRRHVTAFELTVEGETYREEHVQRAYTFAEIQALLRQTDFEALAAYHNFSMRPATEASERIHWVLRLPAG